MEQFVVFRQKRIRTEGHKGGKNRQTYILKHLCISVVLFCVATFFLSADYLFGSEYSGSSEPVNAEADESLSRYRVFSLRYISAEQGQKFLTEAGIGTISRLPGANALLVTARSHELMKASAILKLIDAEQPYVMKTILPASQAQELPAFDKIAAEAGNMSIGTFSDPPGRTKAAGVIIDIHNDVVITVAPESRVDEIVSAIERLQSGEAQTLPPTEPNEPVEEEKDELFNNLLSALEEVKKKEVPSQQVTAVAEQAEPNERVSVPERIEEPAFEPVVQPKEPVLVAEAEETVGEMKIEPEQEFELQPPAGAIQPYEPEPIAGGEDSLKLDLPAKMSIHDFLSFVGEHLHLDYLYDPVKVKGDVTLRLHGKLRGDIKVKDLYPLLESVMKFHRFVMTRKGNLITIVPAGEALDIDPVLLPEKDKLELGDVIITRIFKLQHIDAGSAQNLLTAMRLGADIRPVADKLIVTGYAYRMARVEELLQMIDKPGKPKEFRFRQLRYTMAKTLVPKVKVLAEQLGTISISIAAPGRAAVTRRPGESAEAFRKRQAQARAAQAAGVKPTPAKPTVYLDADERTNRILMIGLEEQLSVVDELINTLDVEQQDLRTMRLYEIQNVGADEVRRKLEELGIVGRGPVTTQRITAPAKAAPSPPRAVSAAEPLVEQPQIVIIESTNSLLVNATAEQHAQVAMIIAYVDSETLLEAIPYKIYSLENQKPTDLAAVLQQLVQETIKDQAGKIEKVVKKGEDISIIPDDNTFSLIVHASKKNQEWIGNLIKTLDKRRPQVLIDVTLVEVSRTDLFDFDLQLASKFPVLEAAGAMDKVGSVLTPFLGEKTSEVYSAPKGTTDTPAIAQGFYHDEHIQALLTAMQSKSYGRVLAKPKVLVNDGQAGTIKTTDTTNVKFENILKGGPNKEDSITVSFKEYHAGITLAITPNISEGDLLLLDVKLTRSDFGERAAGAPPDKTESDIETTVTVPDGRTIILGGLVKLNQSKGDSKVPLLGDIPLVGGLFRSVSNSARDSKLYVFVKANILRPDETLAGLPELEKISERNKVAFEKFEKKFQEHESWPGIKPEPMDPLKVLEVE
ncbi:MAG: secretin N-terminal domain-containing protein [Planctomycetota bacterium]|jgi:type II secretory pathway component GspD/PulD (secretin)